MTDFWWLWFILGAVSAVVLIAAVAAWDERRSATGHRAQLQATRRRVWLEWCARFEWCPHHDVPNGQCPPVESYHGAARGLGMCAGSTSVHRDEALVARG